MEICIIYSKICVYYKYPHPFFHTCRNTKLDSCISYARKYGICNAVKPIQSYTHITPYGHVIIMRVEDIIPQSLIIWNQLHYFRYTTSKSSQSETIISHDFTACESIPGWEWSNRLNCSIVYEWGTVSSPVHTQHIIRVHKTLSIFLTVRPLFHSVKLKQPNF